MSLANKAVLFGTIGMMPAFFLFFALPSIWIGLLYGGKYTEAVPLLRIFAFLSFIVPLMSIETNILMGLGKVRLNFIIGLQMLALAIGFDLLLILPFGYTGAAAGYVMTTLATTIILVHQTNPFVHITLRSVLARRRDISRFILSTLSRR
jgi:O-antigen/teichoic acid export membrane protein